MVVYENQELTVLVQTGPLSRVIYGVEFSSYEIFFIGSE